MKRDAKGWGAAAVELFFLKERRRKKEGGFFETCKGAGEHSDRSAIIQCDEHLISRFLTVRISYQ